MTPFPQAAIYARQSVDEDQGISQQLADCRAEAERRGWPVVAEYRDNDTSGSTERGPKTEWAKMLRAYDSGEFDTLIVNDADRLTRNLTDVLEVRPRKRDMRVIVVRGAIDTADDDYMLKQLVLLGEREIRQKAQRAARYAVERRAKGHPAAGRTPHGYDWVPAADRDEHGTRYAINEDEAQDVRRIFDEFLAGGSMKQIARDLNADYRLTRAAARWGASTVRRILLNPMYAAKLAPAQESGKFDIAAISIEKCGEGAWEPIIKLDQLLAARGRLIGVKPNHDGTARRWLLPGLAVCGVCRGPIRSAKGETHPTAKINGSGTSPQKRYHAYRCVNAGHFMRNGDIIDDFVKEMCIGRLAREDAVDLLTPPEDGPDLAVLNARRTELEGRDSAIASMVARGQMKSEAAVDALDELAAELIAVNKEIAHAVSRDPLAEVVGTEDIRQWWENATLARRRGLVEALMTVVIYPVGKGKRVLTAEAASETVGIEWRREAVPSE